MSYIYRTILNCVIWEKTRVLFDLPRVGFRFALFSPPRCIARLPSLLPFAPCLLCPPSHSSVVSQPRQHDSFPLPCFSFRSFPRSVYFGPGTNLPRKFPDFVRCLSAVESSKRQLRSSSPENGETHGGCVCAQPLHRNSVSNVHARYGGC